MSCLLEAFKMLFAAGVILNADASPVIEGVAQPPVAPVSHADLSALAALPRNWCDAAIRSQRTVIAIPQRARTFGDDHAADYASNARHGKKQDYVTVLMRISRFRSRRFQLLEQALHSVRYLFPLGVQDT
jgi:hypothetical protein